MSEASRTDTFSSSGLYIKVSDGKGRGLYASQPIPAQTLVEVSPVLLFAKDEYEEHGRHTLLDHYTYNWKDGRMALALGLGSIFNHSEYPNVSFSLDRSSQSIRYTTSRSVAVDEELCIFYGHQLWFDDIDRVQTSGPRNIDEAQGQDALPLMKDEVTDEDSIQPQEPIDSLWDRLTARWHLENPGEAVAIEALPFESVRTTPPDPEEETAESVLTIPAWIVDVTNPKMTGAVLKWVHQNTPSTSDPFAHLKRVRRDQSSSLTSVIIIPGSASPTHEPDALHAAPAPQLPPDLALSDPYIAHVPALPALTVSSLALKNVLWPTVYAPRRKNEPEVWTRGRVAWACDAVRTLVQLAAVSRASGNLPIAAYIPPPFIKEDALLNPLTVAVSGVDTRTETGHPLRHAVLAAVRALAAQRAHAESASGPGTANGSHYLLTSLTAFVTHEPCVMCAMALLHSRVKTVVYLAPMPGTGGCGGAACVPALEGVNHRFGIYKWSLEDENWAEWWERSGLEVADGVDA